MFNRLFNLYKIQKLYGLIRDLVERPLLRSNSKHWEKVFKTALSIKEIQEMLDNLKGYKSYAVAILTAAVVVAHSLGYIDDATRDVLLGLLGAGAISTVSAKINRIDKKVDEIEVTDRNNKKFFWILPFLLIIPSLTFAQAPQAGPNSVVGWDQAATSLTDAQAFTYKYYPDSSTTGTALTGVTCAGTNSPFLCQVRIPIFSQGNHTLRLSASNIAGESSLSSPFAFAFVASPPITPTGIRIITP